MEEVMDNVLFIRTPRQKRAIEALLKEESVKVKDLGPRIGALNPRQVIMELRSQGFDKIILTRRLIISDQDGKPCRPGEYYIPSHLKHFAEEILKKNATSGTAKVAQSQSTNFLRGV